jgi:hypothetical protein
MSELITDPSRLAELREMNNYHGQPDRCETCGSAKRAPGLCCIVCGAPNPPITPIMQPDLHREIAILLNKYSAENGSNTPDFILAKYLADCLAAFDKAVTAREKWYGPALGSKPAPVAHGWITNSPTAQGERCCNPPPATVEAAIRQFEAAGGTVKVVPPRSPLSPGSVAD